MAASTATTDSMMPKAMDRKAGLGTIMMAARDASTVSALNATALPAVSTVSATEATIASRSPGSAPTAFERGTEAHDQEEGVVDAQSEGEHQREVEGPDGHRRELGRDHQRTGGHQQSGHGQAAGAVRRPPGSRRR